VPVKSARPSADTTCDPVLRIERVPDRDRMPTIRECDPVVAVTGLGIRVVTARGPAHASGLAMRRMWPIALSFITLAACGHDVPSSPQASSKAAVAPQRGAAGDEDLRVMLSELASSKACSRVRGGFIGLRAPDRPGVVTGVLWIRACEISNAGLHVTFHIAGNGWLWIAQTKDQGGGTFAVRQYVRFGIDTTIQGALDLAYDRGAHVASVWFTPDHPPEVKFTTIGNVDVDRQGVWSSVVGALGTAFATSPEDAAAEQAQLHGTSELAARLANGLAVTINLCTGLSRVQLGRSPKGEMAAADVGETRRIPVELQPGGVMIIGPQLAGEGMTLQAVALQGGVGLTLVCAKDAETIAREFMAGHPVPVVPVLGSVDVRTEARLQIMPALCPVDVVVHPLDDAPARFAWERPTSEIARSTGGPLIHCPTPPAAKP
jgi:hypothetical protein